MRFLVDAQLPPALARYIEVQGYEACAVRDIGLREADDSSIWDFAIQNGWIIVTKDEDFPERVLNSRASPKIVWLRIGNCTKLALLAWFAPLFPKVLHELTNDHRIVEVRE
jgi:predicted nuclease of predicted toxin-antitoxin system